jgi:hypothetical protein
MKLIVKNINITNIDFLNDCLGEGGLSGAGSYTDDNTYTISDRIMAQVYDKELGAAIKSLIKYGFGIEVAQ